MYGSGHKGYYRICTFKLQFCLCANGICMHFPDMNSPNELLAEGSRMYRFNILI